MGRPQKTEGFDEFFKEMQKEIRKEIERSIKDENVRYALHGGKLLRPVMLMLSFKACDGKDHNRALESALGIELAHSASLVHDDITDGDKERRGRPSLYVEKGIGVAIMTGHKMINHAFRIALKHGKKNAKIFLDTWNETLEGELKDIDLSSKLLEHLKEGNVTNLVKDYFDTIKMKTASLFSAACRAGAMEAKAPKELVELLARYGREVGISYQLADDLVDILNGRFDHGLILPMVKLYGKKDGETVNIVEMGHDSISKIIKERGDDLKSIYLEEIEKHVLEAIKLASSDLIKESNYKDMLKEVPKYIVNKMLEEVGVGI